MEYVPTQEDWEEVIDIVNKLPRYSSDTPITTAIKPFKRDLEPILIEKVRELDPLIEQLSKSDLPCDQLELRLKKKELANIEAAYYALKEPEKATAFEEAKQRVKAIPIDSLFKSVHRKGSRLAVTLCIFHEEGTPSLTLYLKKNNAYCYGCKKYADPIEVLMKLHNLTFNEVLKQYGH